MISRPALRPKTLFLIPAILALIFALACGASATATPRPTNITAPTSAPDATDVPATVAPGSTEAPTAEASAPTEAAPDPTPTGVQRRGTPQVISTPVIEGGLAKFDIADAIIDPDRSRVPTGTLSFARHTALSPSWLDPQEQPASITPYVFASAMHDAMVKQMPQGLFTLSLAEHFEMTDDFMKATFRLREGIKFHNGEVMTTEDVKYTYENYRGASADVFADKTESIVLIDERTIEFNFNEPFIDFLVLYTAPATGAGMIIPAAYYEEVGPDGFKQAPIGAGPYKLVGQSTGQEFIYEAFDDYWRKVPHIKTLKIRGVPELASRVAALKTGDVDITYFITGELLQNAIDDPNIRVDPNNSAPFWLFFPGMEEPDNPFNDKRVREAVSLALDRDFLAQAETAGMAIVTGNFIPPEKPGYLEREIPEFNLEKARALMADAGFADGFELDAFTPFPPVFSLAQRIMDSLRDIGITSSLNTTQRPVFLSMLRDHRDGFPGVQIAFSISTGPPDVGAYFTAFTLCNQGSSVTCDDNIDSLMAQYNDSLDLAERAMITDELQTYIHDEFIFVPIYINAFAMGLGPRVAGEVTDLTPVHVFTFPYEDIELNPE